MYQKIVLTLITFLLFQIPQAKASDLKCTMVFKPSRARLTDLFEEYKDLELVELRNNLPGRWVEISGNNFIRYQLFGKKGPVRIHIEGLGGQIEQSLHSKILASHTEKGRVLVIELLGQGVTEVHKRLQLEDAYQKSTREIDYDDNVSRLAEAIKQILVIEKIKSHQISAWSGHSFGGLTLSGLAKRIKTQKPLVLQFLATGVANFNHRFIDSFSNLQISLFGDFYTLLVPGAKSSVIKNAIKSFADDPLFSHFKDDPIQMESAVGLTMGAAKIDTIKDPEHYQEKSHVQIFTGEKDTFVFSMLHWELGQASRDAGHYTAVILIEGVGHYLPTEINGSQQKAVERLSSDPEKYNGFFSINRKGLIKKLSEAEALNRYKTSSRLAWEIQKKSLEDIFSALGQRPTYPTSWK